MLVCLFVVQSAWRYSTITVSKMSPAAGWKSEGPPWNLQKGGGFSDSEFWLEIDPRNPYYMQSLFQLDAGTFKTQNTIFKTALMVQGNCPGLLSGTHTLIFVSCQASFGFILLFVEIETGIQLFWFQFLEFLLHQRDNKDQGPLTKEVSRTFTCQL